MHAASLVRAKSRVIRLLRFGVTARVPVLVPGREWPRQSAVSPPFGTFACAFLPGAGDHAGRVLRAESTTTR
ncbi:Uncharacterised protein [Burkholderia oklahomensis]|nr:hypothetical protein BG90_3828 [Burkholderia oklahomensis C6786]SUY28766.1 Uncharacterised protein [Burkholderia oklahomensis]